VTSAADVRPFAIVAAKADLGRPLDAAAYEALRTAAQRSAWSSEDRRDFLAALRGEHVVEALEVLDVIGWERVMPEWLRVRGLAQHDPYHRFTVDGHLFEAVRETSRALADDPTAATAAHEAGDLDPLFMAALLHDIGKGSGEDHSVAGARLAERICRDMGFDERHVTEITTLVRHHLLLVDTATRRDLDDGAVIEFVSDTVKDGRILRLLLILSIADGRATGPDGWNDWKATLVRDLYRKVLVALETGAVPGRADVRTKVDEVEAYEPSLAGRVQDVLETLPRSYLRSTSVPHMVDEVRLLLNRPGRGEVRWRVDDGLEPGEVVLTVCTLDRPGTLARAAGVLALHRISVLRAHAFSTTDGLALERFIVREPQGNMWEAVGRDLAAEYSGCIALEARI
jgi:[protein-PII] uridylyltransferase